MDQVWLPKQQEIQKSPSAQSFLVMFLFFGGGDDTFLTGKGVYRCSLDWWSWKWFFCKTSCNPDQHNRSSTDQMGLQHNVTVQNPARPFSAISNARSQGWPGHYCRHMVHWLLQVSEEKKWGRRADWTLSLFFFLSIGPHPTPAPILVDSSTDHAPVAVAPFLWLTLLSANVCCCHF